MLRLVVTVVMSRYAIEVLRRMANHNNIAGVECLSDVVGSEGHANDDASISDLNRHPARPSYTAISLQPSTAMMFWWFSILRTATITPRHAY